jgi:hypothetical protein
LAEAILSGFFFFYPKCWIIWLDIKEHPEGIVGRRLYKTTSVWISIGPTVLRKAKNMTDKICKNLSWVLSK